MLKILVANIPLPANRFLVDLNTALLKHVDLIQDHQAFWNMTGTYDAVHLHFPEYTTYEIERAYQTELTNELISQIEVRLKFWSSNSVLIITRHVLLPHHARSDPRWEKLYETYYRHVRGVVHFAQPSVDEFNARYAATAFIAGRPQHCIIPHHNYASLPNEVDRSGARKALGIAEHANVVLVFGAIRNDAERDLVLDSFQAANIPNKVLLVSRWREQLPKVSWIRLKYWLRDLIRLYYRMHPNYRLNYDFVPENETQFYLHAADIMFIPRLRVLNSGNVTLGMTFGKVVVGPDSLDVGYLLRTTGNVVFDPQRPDAAAQAMEHALSLVRQDVIGPANRRLALAEWSVEQCAERYFDFFSELTLRRATE